jgi:Domain of unknown function (DUF4148)
MNSKLIIATTLIALAGAGSAFAQEGTQEFTATKNLSTKSRAEVKAELQSSQRRASDAAAFYGYGEASAAPVAASTITRTQVQAETREAQRLGLIQSDEASVRIATPAQAEAIRLAGQRAIQTPVAGTAR